MAPVTTSIGAVGMVDEDEIERLRHDIERLRHDIERLRHEGHVHWWARRDTAWPGHTTFVALRGSEVVVGDRYASEGVERTYACELSALLDGCFQELVAQQLGPRVLEELLAEVRRELGVTTGAAASPKAGPTTKNAQEPAKATPAATPVSTPAATATPASTPAATATPASTPAATATPVAKATGATAGASAPVAPASPPKAVSAPPKPSEQPSPAVSGARVDVALVACQSVSLPLAVALRGIMRAPVQELLGRLRSLPCRVAAGVPREQAEGLAARLAELGAEVLLLPTNAS